MVKKIERLLGLLMPHFYAHITLLSGERCGTGVNQDGRKGTRKRKKLSLQMKAIFRLKVISTLTSTATGFPHKLAGVNRQLITFSIASSSRPMPKLRATAA